MKIAAISVVNLPVHGSVDYLCLLLYAILDLSSLFDSQINKL